MKASRTISLITFALVLGAGSASWAADAAPMSARPSQPQACFHSRNVNSFAPVGDRKVNLRVGVHDYYQITLLGRCSDLDWTHGIGLEHRGSNWICSGQDVTVIVPGRLGDRCPGTDLRKLTPEEVAALPKKERP